MMRRTPVPSAGLIAVALLPFALACGRLEAEDAPKAGAPSPAHVTAAFRDIPVLQDADVVVAGGSSAAVAAACAAAGRGAQVVLLAPRPYLGDDLCGRQHLWLEEGEKPDTDLARSLFPDGRVTTPFAVKRALDQALLARGVRFLTGCPATDLLVDDRDRPAGVIATSRSGRLAVRAKAVIDATPRALLARQSGARFRPFAPGETEGHFIVVGGSLQSGPGLSGRTLDVSYRNPSRDKNAAAFPVHAYIARMTLADAGFAAFARAAQDLRNRACAPGMVDCAEYATVFPADTVIGEARVEGPWPGAAGIDPGAFRPKGMSGLFVLGLCADVSAESQKELVRPLAALAVGGLVGEAAAQEAAGRARPADARLAPAPAGDAVPVTVGEPRDGTFLPGPAGVVRGGPQALPVWGRYDVVVVGGGTAGAPAGIAAARNGARTLVVEYLDELGGVGTAGLIGSYWYGSRGGFTKEVEEAIGGRNRWEGSKKDGWNVVQKSEWLRRELLKVGADLWCGSFGCGAVVDSGRVVGVVVATPFGRGVVLARVVVDATGNADVAEAAGAETQYGVAPGGMLSVQLAGYPHRNLGDNVNNTCFALVDDTRVQDIAHLMAWGRSRMKPETTYDAGQLLDSRERRRIVADFMLATPDIVNHRSFPDTISHHKSNFDAAAFPTSPMLLVKDMKGPAFEVDLPYRSLLPRGLDGILVTGLGAGAERDAMTLVRMQADLQNQGYAAGTAAAMAAALGGRTRAVDVKALQKRLVDRGILEPRVLTDRDSCPMPAEAVRKAVEDVGALRSEIRQSRSVADPAIFSLAVVMAHPDQALPLLRMAHDAAADAGRKRVYARILGVLGDRAGAATLAAAVRDAPGWDAGYGLTSHRESDNTFSETDRLVIALGLGGAPEGLEAIVGKVGQLQSSSETSHFIAASLALHRHRSPLVAAEPLARLLDESGFAGHAQAAAADTKQGQWTPRDVATTKPDSSLNASLKELLVAGMLVHAGDSQGRGRKILEQYAGGLSGHFARYAQHVLQDNPPGSGGR